MRRAIDAAALRAYAARDWGAVRAAKARYWRDRLDRGGLAEALRVTHELSALLHLLDSSWPTEKQREEDLETHRRVAEALSKTVARRR